MCARTLIGIRTPGFIALLVSPLALSGCSWSNDGLLGASGPIAELQRDHLLSITGIALVVVLPVLICLPIILWRYRFGRKDSEYRPDWNFAWGWEAAIWGVPVVIVAILSWNLWHQTHRLDPYHRLDKARPPLHVQVIGMDWKWLFLYPEQGVASVNELVVPAGREVAFTLTADGPMMSFMVPRLGGQIYAMAGMETKMHLAADKPGSYRGLNTQYNGENFHAQKFILRAVSSREYNQWLSRAKTAPGLSEAGYARLARPSVIDEPMLFGSSPDRLFDRVIAKFHHAGGPPAPLRVHPPHPAEESE